MIRSHPLLIFVAAGALAGCDEMRAGDPVAVSVIGGAPTLVDTDRLPPAPAQRVLIGAVAAGLVSFDAAGQIEPALAERWIVTDDGLSYIFRLRDATGADGAPITANDVARRLRAAIAAKSRNRLKAALEAIDEIVVITPEVLEIRLTTPRPPLLHLLAQPELALIAHGGGGPMRSAEPVDGKVVLTPLPEPGEDAVAEAADGVVLRGETPAMAIVRFSQGETDLVLGGRFVDLPLVRATTIQARDLRVDPAEGLFGLSIVGTSPFLDNPDNRRALAMAIDRQGIIDTFGIANWQQTLAILPERYRSNADPAVPGWSILTLAQRQATARTTIDAWRAESGDPPRLRVTLPQGPGATLLFARLAADWMRIGVIAERVAPDAETDLRLIDRVAPAPSAIWYLSLLGCAAPTLCDEAAIGAIGRARAAPTLGERGQALAEADQAIASAARFIVLARPLRWSLVGRRLNQFRENPRAWHPLNHLRGPIR